MPRPSVYEERARQKKVNALGEALMARLRERTTPELIALYWELRGREVDHEAEDLRRDAVPHGGSTWAERADASETDAATDLLLGSIERIFGIRGVSDEEVWAGRPR